jgi:hypothetical protein
MTAIASQVSVDHMALPQPAPSEHSLIEHLRDVARINRCKAYIDLFGACASLSGNRDIALHAASEVLVRCLAQALGHRPVLYRVGEMALSFDEKWLVALARSLKTGDEASATFLLHSRVPKHAHRNLVFLLHRVAERFSRI